MDQRIESFLTDVLALAGKDLGPVRDGVRVALADCEAIFRARQDDGRMRDQAARICRVLCRSRVVAELHERGGNPARGPFEAGAQHHGRGGYDGRRPQVTSR
jgi:hypothetical protein